MPQVACVEIYSFSELSEPAKERARNWYRENCLDYNWWTDIYDDTIEIAKLLGIEIKTRTINTSSNTKFTEPCIYFSGFWSQGDGACYEGTYHYAKKSVNTIKQYAPEDKTLHKIANGLYAVQKEHFYGLSATIRHSGQYCHEYCMDILVEPNYESCNFMKNGAEMEVIDLLRQFAKWIYKRLQKEYEFLISDEMVDDIFYYNNFDFYEDGNHASYRLLRCA